MKIRISKAGVASFIYEEELDLCEALGKVKTISRASSIEPNNKGEWWIKYLHSQKILGPFNKKSEAVKQEIKDLERDVI